VVLLVETAEMVVASSSAPDPASILLYPSHTNAIGVPIMVHPVWVPTATAEMARI
jgi:hypothetical protein